MRTFPKGPQVLFQYYAGQDFKGMGGSFTRATLASYIDSQGRYRVAAAGELRDRHYINGDGPLLLIEPQRVQLVTTPDTPASWTSFGTPTITTGIVDPWGGSNAIMVTDSTAAQRTGVQPSPAPVFTGDGTKAVVIALRAGTAAQVACVLRDATAGSVDRHAVSVVWQSGTLPPICTTTSGSGTIFTPLAVYDRAGNLWWLIRFTVNNVVAANTNNIFTVVGTNSAETGTFYVAGMNAWNSDQPWSWQGASFATRNADVVTFAGGPTPQACTILLDYVEIGGAATSSARLLQLGNVNTPRWSAHYTGTTRTVRLQHENSTTLVLSTASNVVAYGDKVLVRGVLTATGSTIAGTSRNGGAEVVGTTSSPAALEAAWAGGTGIYIGHNGAGNNMGGLALRRVRIVAGVQSLAAMTYDFLTAIQSESAEFVHLLELTFSGGPVRLCTGAQDLLWDSLTWEAVGGLLQFGGVEETTDARAQGVDVKLSGVDQTVAALLLTNQYRGRAVKIYRAHLDKSTGLVVGEPLLLFQGLQLSPYTIEEQRDRGGGTVQIGTRFSGYFGVSRVRGIQTNLVSHQHHFAGDTFFQYTSALTNAKVYWGTAGPAAITRGAGGTVKDDTHQEPWK